MIYSLLNKPEPADLALLDLTDLNLSSVNLTF